MVAFVGAQVPGIIYQPKPSRYYVHVANGLSTLPLTVHCQSKDDDLGIHHLPNRGDDFQWNFKDDDLGLHTLPPTADFSWSFEANFFHTTLFWCRLQKGGGGGGVEAAFKVFWHDARLFEKCGWKNCVWIAKDDGIYIKNFAKGIDELSYTWEG
ncbi:S-protein homolog 1-like [Cucurbita moschata]|uniref:S-protein homolog n=1 Tax=Cucurbita moschata TaxID=3662 RepID=A0A6J1GQY7_CUCMO|nr:S-protein homolog 1-like [Cucurbita moschata]